MCYIFVSFREAWQWMFDISASLFTATANHTHTQHGNVVGEVLQKQASSHVSAAG